MSGPGGSYRDGEPSLAEAVDGPGMSTATAAPATAAVTRHPRSRPRPTRRRRARWVALFLLLAAMGLADEAVVLDVYAAREDPEPGVTGGLVADAVPGGRALFLPDRTQVAPLIARIAEPGDVVLTMGAGDVTALGPQLVDAIGRRPG